uniref:HMG box domain-containing protein n=1 Tax=Glossina austeni TaxID=7395 RepID=A0A1A9VIM8_GLOAU
MPSTMVVRQAEICRRAGLAWRGMSQEVKKPFRDWAKRNKKQPERVQKVYQVVPLQQPLRQPPFTFDVHCKRITVACYADHLLPKHIRVRPQRQYRSKGSEQGFNRKLISINDTIEQENGNH